MTQKENNNHALKSENINSQSDSQTSQTDKPSNSMDIPGGANEDTKAPNDNRGSSDSLSNPNPEIQTSRKKPLSFKQICCLIMDFIVSVKTKVLVWLLLLLSGLGMFIISTTQNSPELREFSFSVDERTSCDKDTLTKFILNASLNPYYTTILESDSTERKAEGLLGIGLVYSSVESSASPIYSAPEQLGNPYGKSYLMRIQGYEAPDTTYFHQTFNAMFNITNNIVRITQDSNEPRLALIYITPDINRYLLPSDKNNPYIMTYFHFDFKDDVLDLNTHLMEDAVPSKIFIETHNLEDNFEKRASPLNIISVWPTPDHVGPDGIIFNTKESVETALRNGIFISAEDLTKKQLSDRRIFFYTLLLGVIVSWLITLSVSLILHFHKYLHQSDTINKRA